VSGATLGELLARCLRALGARRVFGLSAAAAGLPGLEEHPVAEPALAALLADADGRTGVAPGLALLPDRRLRVTARPGALAEEVVLADPDALASTIAGWPLHGALPCVEYLLDLDLGAPAPPAAGPLRLDPGAGNVPVLAPELAGIALAVLVGPGVVHAGRVEGLRELAAHAGVGVVNTWGAKGVFVWDSPFHAGTAGLQERDFVLAGLPEAELVVTSGLDPAEVVGEGWRGAQVLDVEPWQLATLTMRWPGRTRRPERTRLYRELSAALGPTYTDDSVPLSPARAAADLAATVPPGGLVAADPGPAGLWVARAFPTSEPGSVVVPSLPVRGFAAAAAVVGGLRGRPVVGVVTDPLDDTSRALLELAGRWQVPVVLEVWGADEDLPGAAAHPARLRAAMAAGGVSVLGVPVDFSLTRLLVEVAGPVVAWGGSGT
jgi:hypothetical protein